MRLPWYRERIAILDRLNKSKSVEPYNVQSGETNWFGRMLYGPEQIYYVLSYRITARPSDEQLAEMRLLNETERGWSIDVKYPINDDDLRRIVISQRIHGLGLEKPQLTRAGWSLLYPIKFNWLSIQNADFDDDDLCRFDGLEHVERLELRDTKVTGTGLPGDLSTFHFELVFDGSPITDEGLQKLSKTEFSRLSLARTNVTGIGFANFMAVSEIGGINLSGSAVTDEGLRGINHLKIVELNLSQTRITGVSLKEHQHLKLLNEMDLSHTDLTDEGMAFLEKAFGLGKLNLSGCKISGAGLQHIYANRGLYNRLDLKLDDMTLTDDDLDGLKKVTEISSISLVGTNITGVGFRHFTEDCQIGSIDMTGTKLNEAGLREIARLKNLKCLVVDPKLVPVAQKIFAEEMQSATVTTQDAIKPPPVPPW